MIADIKNVALPMKAQVLSVAENARGFVWHFIQMVLAMEAGMMVYHMFLSPLLYQTPFGPLTDAYPIIGYWGMVVSMVLGMLVLMLLQKSTGRYCVEMTLAMVVPVATLTVLAVCSLVPNHILYGFGDPVMFIAMAIYMLYRPHNHAHRDPTQACH